MRISNKLFTTIPFVAASIALASAGAPAQAADGGTAQAKQASASSASRSGNANQNARNENNATQICVTQDGVGTRVARQLCKTRAQWLRDEGEVPGE